MPLSSEQRRLMKQYLRANTFYTDGSYVAHTIEMAIDNNNSVTVSDLFLPNDIIKNKNKKDFWFRMASIICSDEVKDWHELEYGSPINTYDKRSRYIFTWTFQGDTYKFYTKVLRHGRYAELVWYINSQKTSIDDCISDNDEDTDSDEIELQI
jgi:hypothetical protein